MRNDKATAFNRMTFILVTAARKRLLYECAKIRSVEGAKVAPARIINALIMAHLDPCPDEGNSDTPREVPRRKRRQPQLAKTA